MASPVHAQNEHRPAEPVGNDDHLYDEKKSHDPASHGGVLEANDLRAGDASSLKGGEDILGLQDLDPVMNMKMHLVNNVRPSRPS